MARRTALLTVPLLALTALVGPLGGASYASTCGAVAEPPHLVPGEIDIHASGTFGCLDAVTGMTVTACIEEKTGTGEWWQLGCETTTVAEAAQTVTGKVQVPMMVYSTWLRTTVTATNDAGDTAAAKTPQVFWFNCACYVG
jgi:hypothetical protein